MGPFEAYVTKKCEQLSNMVNYFPEFESELNWDINNIKSWINPYILESLENKYTSLYNQIGIYPDAFLTWLQISCRLVSREVNQELITLDEQGLLPSSQEARTQIYKEKLATRMAKLYNISKEDYLKACG